MSRRSALVTSIVTEMARNWNENASSFLISSEFQESALNKLFTKFEEWSGVDIKACKNAVQNWGQYWDRADNWFNRNKAKIYGNHLFYPIVFRKIYQVNNICIH